MGRKQNSNSRDSSAPLNSGFVGFSSFSRSPPTTGIHDSENKLDERSNSKKFLPLFYDGSNSSLSLLFKKLLKKDSTTKLRALQEFSSLCISTADAGNEVDLSEAEPLTQDDFVQLIPHWIYIYLRLSLDNNRKIREMTNDILGQIISSYRKSVVPYLENFIGSWWMCMSDPSFEVAQSAKNAYIRAFPSENRRTALVQLHRADITDFLLKTLEKLPDIPSNSSEEADECHERVTTSCLLALSSLLTTNTGNIPFSESDRNSIVNAILKYLLDSQSICRKSACQLLVSYCEACPYLLNSEDADESSKNQYKRLTSTVLKLINETDSSNHPTVWSTILRFIKSYPVLVENSNAEAILLRPILSKLRSGTFIPSASVSYSSLLPFLAVMPTSVFTSFQPSASSFFVQFLDSIKCGLVKTKSDLSASCSISMAHIECTLFILKKFGPDANNQVVDPECMEDFLNSMRNHIFDAFFSWFSEPDGLGVRTQEMQSRSQLSKMVSSLTESLSRGIVYLCNAGYINPIVDFFLSGLDQASTKKGLLISNLLNKAHGLSDTPESLNTVPETIFVKCLQTCTEMAENNLSSMPPSVFLVIMNQLTKSVRISELLNNKKVEDLLNCLHHWILLTPFISEELDSLLGLMDSILASKSNDEKSAHLRKLISDSFGIQNGRQIVARILYTFRSIKLSEADTELCIDSPVLSLARIENNDVSDGSIEFMHACFGSYQGLKYSKPLLSHRGISDINSFETYSSLFTAAMLPILSKGSSYFELISLLDPCLCRLLKSAMHSMRLDDSMHSLWDEHVPVILRKIPSLWEKLSRSKVEELTKLEGAFIVNDIMDVISLQSLFGAIDGGILWQLRIVNLSYWSNSEPIESLKSLFKFTKLLLQSIHTTQERLNFIYQGINDSPVEDKQHYFQSFIWVILNAAFAYHEVPNLSEDESNLSNITFENCSFAAIQESHKNSSILARAMCTDFGASCDINRTLFDSPAKLLLPDEFCDLSELTRAALLGTFKLGMEEIYFITKQGGIPSSCMHRAMSELSACIYGCAFSKGIGSASGKHLISMYQKLDFFQKSRYSLADSDLFVDMQVAYKKKYDGKIFEYIEVQVVAVHSDSAEETKYVTVRHADGREIQTELSNLFDLACTNYGHLVNNEIDDPASIAAYEVFEQFLLPLTDNISKQCPQDINSVQGMDVMSICVRATLSMCKIDLIQERVLPKLQKIWMHWVASINSTIKNKSRLTLKFRIDTISTSMKIILAIFKCTPYLIYQNSEIFEILENLNEFTEYVHGNTDNNIDFRSIDEFHDVLLDFVANIFGLQCGYLYNSGGSGNQMTKYMSLLGRIILKCFTWKELPAKCNSNILHAVSNCLSCEAVLLIQGNPPSLSSEFKQMVVNFSLEKFSAACTSNSNVEVYSIASICCCLLIDLASDNHLLIRTPSDGRFVWQNAIENSHVSGQLYDVLRRHGSICLQVCAYHILSAIASCVTIEPAELPAIDTVKTGSSEIAISAEEIEAQQQKVEENTVNRCIPERLLNLLGSIRNRIEVDLLGSEEDEFEIEKSTAVDESLSESQHEKFSAFFCFLPWLLCIRHVQRADACEQNARSILTAYVHKLGIIGPLLHACFHMLHNKEGYVGKKVAGKDLNRLSLIRLLDNERFKGGEGVSIYVYFHTVEMFPALVRSWWTDACAKGLRNWVEDFTRIHVTPTVISRELEHVSMAYSGGRWNSEGLTIKTSANSGEVSATYMKDECTLEIFIKMPHSYPLSQVEVNCPRKVGITNTRWRRWVLQIITLLSVRGGSVLDAVLLWKKNVDKEFEGMEPCVICYSTLHPRDMALPSLTCKTCSNQFHPTCLYKWFQTSHKNKCPLCQQTWA